MIENIKDFFKAIGIVIVIIGFIAIFIVSLLAELGFRWVF